MTEERWGGKPGPSCRFLVIVHGDCPTGVDRHAHNWVEGMQPLGHDVREESRHSLFFPTWTAFNADLASRNLDGAVQFPGGPREAHLHACCIREGVKVWRPPMAWQ